MHNKLIGGGTLILGLVAAGSLLAFGLSTNVIRAGAPGPAACPGTRPAGTTA